MEHLSLYEKIPQDLFPVRLLLCDTKGAVPFQLHWHEHLEIHYVLEGESTVRCGDSQVSLTKGDCLVINSAQLHQWVSGDYRYLCLLLPPSFTENRELVFQNFIQDQEIARLIEEMWETYQSERTARDMLIKGKAYLLLAKLCEAYTVKVIKDTGAYFSQKTALNQAIKHIHENFTREICLDEVAEMLYVNKYYFCHLFKNETGKTLKEYVNELRTNKAADLLATTDMSMTEIAGLCGFNDANYYARMFKKLRGVSPTEYRKRIT